MLKLISFLFYKFPLLLAWLYLFVAIFSIVVHIKQSIRKAKISCGRWVFSILNAGYMLLFLISRIFFPDFWDTFFGVIGLLAVVVAFLWSRYEDKRNGNRWWNW